MQEGVMFGGDPRKPCVFCQYYCFCSARRQSPRRGNTMACRKIANPSYEFSTVEARILTQDEAMKDFDQRIRKTPKRQVLIFVHGFR